MKYSSLVTPNLATGHWLLAAVALAMLLPACSTMPKVNTQAKPGADYTRYRTFALMPLPGTAPASESGLMVPASGLGSDPGLMLRVAEPARQAAVEALTAKGLTKADRADADIAVNLRGQSLPTIGVADWGYNPAPVYGRAARYSGGTGSRFVEVRSYEERTLTIEIFDNHTKDLVWVGWSEAETTGEVKVEMLQQAIRNILAEFPPRTTPSTP